MPNRTICDVLREMRALHKTRNYSSLLALIEEAQSMANRMEAALWDQDEFTRTRESHKKLKQEVKDMKRELGKDANRWSE